ncbi:MAG: helix-turn-helix domain-containing protein [Rubellimicrobium sp.]|nr:helix-turn-helix domain-containing protein [Rubellimicrobium sp.]
MFPGTSLLPRFRIDQRSVQLSAQRPVRAQRLSVTSDVEAHDHAFHEICVKTGGTARHLTGETERLLAPGDVFVVPPGAVHALLDVRYLRVINAYYLSEWLVRDLGMLWAEPGAVPLFLSRTLMKFRSVDVVQFRLDGPDLSMVVAELDQIEDAGGKTAGSGLELRGCFHKIIAAFSRGWIRADPTAATIEFRQEVWDAMEAIERAVANSSPFSVSRHAELAGMSADHFAALFRESTGYGPMDYFQRRRIHRACQLLLSPRLSATEVAFDAGFSDAPHFCRVFKRHTGMTPMQYRRIYGG